MTKEKNITSEYLAESEQRLPPLWPETIIKMWDKWPSSIRNQLRYGGWSLQQCQRIVKTDAWAKWKRTRRPRSLKPIQDMLPGELSPRAPMGGSDEWPSIAPVISKSRQDMLVERVEKDYIMKPYPNESACRHNAPGKYAEFRRGSRESGGKTYHIIYGRISRTSDWEEQAYRYPISSWTADQARAHCTSHDGQAFEAATGKVERAAAPDPPLAESKEEKLIVRVAKADYEKQWAYGIVLAPDEEDSQKDYITGEEIEDAIDRYMLRVWSGEKPEVIGKEHETPIEGRPVQCFQAPVDFWYEGTPHTDEYLVPKDSWVLVTHMVEKKDFEKAVKGEYRGYSLQGYGTRKIAE